MSDNTKYPGLTDEAFPDVYNKMPPQPTEKKDGQLPEEMIRQFFEEGYLVVNDYFPIDLLEKCKERIEKLVDELANKLYAAGKIKDLYKDSGFYERLIKLDNEFPGAPITIHKGGYMHEEIAALWSNERLLNLVEQLIGPDIAGHVVWNLRSKIPRYEQTTVPWHQDNGYLDESSYSVLQPTAWIPLLDITKENGALQVARRGHKTGRIATHTCCAGDTWYINLDEKEMEKTLGTRMKY